MSNWVTDAEVEARLGYKILIAGLSEAGKTAVKRIFFLKKTTKDVDSLSATINYERMSVTINETPVTIVDLGGQKIFLKRFLSGFSPFIFSSVHTFIYLIDVANKTSRNNSIDYFRGCVEKLNEFSPESELFVFLHKNDLVRNSPNYESIHEQLKEQFQLETDKRIRFFRTTIYKPESVNDSFGRIFELCIPEISQSEFVDGRIIGEIEEYHSIGMTLREPSEAEETTPTVTQVEQPTPKVSGDPLILAKLHGLMQQAIKIQNHPTNEGTQTKIFLGNAANEESSSETILTHIEASSSPKISVTDNIQISQPSIADVQNNSVSILDDDSLQTSKKINLKVNHLIEFYRISEEKAVDIVKSGYLELFETTSKTGIPIPLVMDIILKYIPFIEKSQGKEKSELLNQKRLLEMFYVYLKGSLREEDIVKCLIFMVEKPKMTVDDIVKSYLFQKVEKNEEKIEKRTVEEETPQYAKLEIPIETETIEGIISLPQAQGMGFKIDLLEPDGLNVQISFHLQGPMGQRELIGSSIVSRSINTDEILYLLAYELNMKSIGFFEDGMNSMRFAAKIIHETIQQLCKNELNSTKDIKTQVIRKSIGKIEYRAEQINYIVPLEIQIKGDHFIIPDSENVAFNVGKAEKGFKLSFIQRGFPIGEVNVIESINIQQLSGLLKTAMQLPIESDGAIEFTSRIIHSVITGMMKSEKVQITSKPMIKPIEVIEEDETSDQLKKYLSLLEDR